MTWTNRIDMWRSRVPSRLERDDPFENDGFESRPVTRLVSFFDASEDTHVQTYTSQRESLLTNQTFRDEIPARPSTRLSFFRPLSTVPSRPVTSLDMRDDGKKRNGLLSLFGRKRKFCPPSPEIPREPARLNFLFVGSRSSGQTSLLL